MNYFIKGMELLNSAMERNKTELKIKCHFNRGSLIELRCEYNPLTRRVKLGLLDCPITCLRKEAKLLYGLEIVTIDGGRF